MSDFKLWFWLILLIFIHALDMELTYNYIGNNWVNETFLPMQRTIKEVGIVNACWISRILVYTYIFLTLINKESNTWRSLLVVVTILYWTAMFNWLCVFGYWTWK